MVQGAQAKARAAATELAGRAQDTDTSFASDSPASGVSVRLLRRALAYRPERRSVLLTASVLLVLLRPGLVLAALLLCGILVAACYCSLGADAFWRRLLGLHQAWARRQPEPARRAWLRAMLLSRKWERLIARWPDRLADRLRPPDLRGLLAADARHHAALSDRLGRLQQDILG
jgi:hypothetical protein